MSEDTTVATTATDTDPETGMSIEDQLAEAQASIERLEGALGNERNVSRDARSEAKTAKDSAAELTQKLTTAETERDEAKTKISEITNARVHDLRVQVATAAGLDPKIAPRLSGSNREELEADAKMLAGAFVGGEGLDGGARATVKPALSPEEQNRRFIQAAFRGESQQDAEEAAGGLWD